MSERTETVYFGCGSAQRRRPLFEQLHGVTATRVGYMGGWTAQPSATQVASRLTGHTEVVEVTYDTNATKLTALLKAFFSFHDATLDRAGDGGPHGSVVFCRKAKHNIVTERAIALLRKHGLDVATRVKDAGMFWEAQPERQPSRLAAKSQVPEADTTATEASEALRAMSLVEAATLKPAEARALVLAG